MTDSDGLALRIYQSILDGSGDAVNLKDFDRYSPFFHMPNVLETFEGRTRITSVEALRVLFDKLQIRLGELGVSRMERTCTVAQFDGAGTIRGVHDTRLVGPDGMALETYSGMSTLASTDGQWRVILSQFVEETVSLPSMTLRDCVGDAASGLVPH